MNWYIIFYLFSLADKISAFSLVISWITGIIGAIVVISYIFNMVDGSDWDDSDYKTWRTWAWISVAPFLFFITLYIFIPSREDMLIIIAGGTVGEYVESDENLQEIPHDVTRFLRKEILQATMEEGNEALKEAIGIESEKDKLMKKSKEELVKMLEEK